MSSHSLGVSTMSRVERGLTTARLTFGEVDLYSEVPQQPHRIGARLREEVVAETCRKE
jgi:hypothetical protein